MLGKVFIGIIAIFILFGAFASPISDGIKGWRSDDLTENFIVATGVGVTTANVTLTRDLYNFETAEVIGIDSTLAETPVATSYDSTTKKLLVSALNANTSRTLTVEYYGETTDTVMRAIGPYLAFLIIGGLAFMVIWGIWQGKRRRG